MRIPPCSPRLARFAVALLLAAVASAPAPGSDAASEPASPLASAPPQTIRWPSAAGEVVFEHQFHAEETGADCVACHHETVAASLAVPHADYFDDFWVDCATCHTGAANAGARRCSTCHPEQAAGPNVEMPTAKVAIHRSCWSCHETSRGAAASAQCGICHQRPATPASAAPAGEPVAAK